MARTLDLERTFTLRNLLSFLHGYRFWSYPIFNNLFFSFFLFFFQIDLFFSGEIYPWNKTLTRKGEISWGLVASADVSAGAMRRTTVVCAKDSKLKRL